MEITAQQYISNSSGGGSYVKVFKHFYDKTDRKVNKKGDIYALIYISSEKKVSAERLTKFVWDSIVDGYLYSTSPTTNESLKDSVQAGLEKVKNLIRNDRELEGVGVEISFTIVLAKEEGLYVGVCGDNDVYAYKKGSVVNISEILSEKVAKTAGITLEEDELLMISSEGFLDDNISKFAQTQSSREIQQVLNTMGSKLGGCSAVMYFKQKKDSPEIVKSEKPKVHIPNIAEVKDEARKLLKPKARVEKINKPKDQKTLPSITDNASLGEFIGSVNIFFGNISKKVSPFFSKIWIFLKGLFGKIQEKVLSNIGKKRWYKKIASRLSEVRIKKRKPVGVAGMRIDDYKTRDTRGKRFKMLFTGIVIVALLILGVRTTLNMKEAREISRLAEESFVQIEELVRKSEEEFVTDRSSVETYLFKAEKLLDEIPKGLNDDDLEKYNSLKREVLELGDSLYKRVGYSRDLANLTSYLDPRLSFGEGSDPTDIAIQKDKSGNEFLFVADAGRGSVYRISLYDKSVEALPDSQGLVKEPLQVYVGMNGVYVLDSKEGMLKAAFDESGWFSSFVSLSGLGSRDIKAEEIAEMTVWTLSDNVYFLSNDKQGLLKSTVAYGDRYGLAYTYINSEHFANATDMVADLSIYVVTPEDPKLVRFNYSFYENQFYEASLGVLGFDGKYGNLTKAYTGDNLDYGLYLFDAEARRFLKFEKPIESGADIRHPDQISLLNQYVYRGEDSGELSDLRNFVVDSTEDNIYILEGSNIWKLRM